jgi:hypothetical protein
MLKPWLVGGLLVAILVCPGPVGFAGGEAHSASFNCARAATPTEVGICANSKLSALDSALAPAYARRLSTDDSMRYLERGWLEERNGCGRAVACLDRMMTWWLGWLRSDRDLPSGLPRRAGDCSLTAVKQVESRLQGVPGSGSAIRETNGAYQVSYDRLPAIDAANPEDPVLLCLISIPQHCPPGDNRGRLYGGADMLSEQSWVKPDAEHMCGGA